MSQYPHLKNAPIKEALVDIRVELDPKYDVMMLKGLGTAVAAELPDMGEMFKFKGSIVDTGKVLSQGSVERVKSGFVFCSSNRSKVLQARYNGFTYSVLKPYSSWSQFLGEARELWTKYQSIAPVNEIKRLGVRYINELRLPQKITSLEEFKKYINIYPHLPSVVPQNMDGFSTRIVTNNPESGISVNITVALDNKSVSEYSMVLLDIDVYHEVSSSMGDEIWGTFDRLRALKNDLFFGSVAEQIINQYT